MMRQKEIPKKKRDEVALLKKYCEEYNVIGLVSMEKMDARSITKLRKALRGQVVMRMSKKRLIKRALGESKKKNLVNLADEIKGSSAIIFTNMNPVSLSQFLKDRATKGPAKAGDIAPEDIVVKAGNTRIAPGPIISELNSVLKLPTMIKDGTIHIRQDTTTHHTGDSIDLKAALLLGRLGLEPMTITLDFYSAWENGEILPEAVLKLDAKKIIGDVQAAHSAAFNFALSLGILTKETVSPMMMKSIREATAIAFELPIVFVDIIPMYISKGVQTAHYIDTMIFGEEAIEEEEEKEEKKDDDRSDDEVMGSGIADLFG